MLVWERSRSLACRVRREEKLKNLHDVVEHVDAESGDELVVVVGGRTQLEA